MEEKDWLPDTDVVLPVVVKALGFRLRGDGPDSDAAGPEVLNVYQLGSRVYRTAEPGSDWDFLFVVPNDYVGTNLIDRGQFNASIFTLDTFQGMVRDHHFIALYCVFLPRENVWLEVDKLKKAFFMKACSSMNRAKVYCKQAHKLSLEDKPQSDQDQLLRKSKKMLTHSLRYLHFGIQLFETGRIEDYLVANPYWEEVRPMTSLLWEDYESRFRPTYLHLMERFPKDPVKPIDQANTVPPLYRKFYCYLHSPEQTNTKNDRHVLEKEVLHVLLEQRKAQKEEKGREEDLGFAAYFPEHADLYADIEKRVDRLCASVQSAYDRIAPSRRQEKKNEEGEEAEDEEKKFAKRVANEEWKGIMFRMRRNETSAHDVILQSALKSVHQWLTTNDRASA